MVRLIGAIVLCMLGAVFVIQNADHVSLQLFVGDPLRIRLIFLLMSCFAVGYLTCFFTRLKHEVKLRRKIKILDALRPKKQADDDHWEEGVVGH